MAAALQMREQQLLIAAQEELVVDMRDVEDVGCGKILGGKLVLGPEIECSAGPRERLRDTLSQPLA